MLRSELIVSERKQFSGRSRSDVSLELGNHPIAQELRALQLGRILACQYTPQHQLILTPVVEFFSVRSLRDIASSRFRLKKTPLALAIARSDRTFRFVLMLPDPPT